MYAVTLHGLVTEVVLDAWCQRRLHTHIHMHTDWLASISVRQLLARHRFTLRDHVTDARLMHPHGVPVYVPAFADTDCAYPRKDGQAELAWVAGIINKIYCITEGNETILSSKFMYTTVVL